MREPTISAWISETNRLLSTRRGLAATVVACACVAGMTAWLMEAGDRPEEVGADRLSSVGPVVVSGRSRRDYVGSQVCSECHADVAAEYARSPMSRSWTSCASSVPDNLHQPGTVRDEDGKYTYEVRLENGRLLQTELLSDNADYRRSVTADYIVGSGNHACAMVAQHNGYLVQLPVGWFPHENRWKLNPGYELKNHRFDRPVVPGCLSCHGGYAAPRDATGNRYELPVTEGIGCEHCHGPGREHVAYHEGRDATQVQKSDPIINPARLEPRERNDVCLQCHLQGDVVVFREGANAFSFRPGERLSDHRFDFLLDTDQDFGIASHGARLMKSRCATPDGASLTCIHCHDAHRPASDITAADYDARCISCHAPASCERTVEAGEIKDARGCVRCHMPRRDTRESQHLVFTDHWIRAHRFEANDRRVPPHLPPDATVHLVNPWPDDDPLEAYLGMGYVKLHTSMGPQRPAVSRGLELLDAALASTTSGADVRFWLATGQLALARTDQAVSNLENVLTERPDWHEARFRLAIAYHHQGQTGLAIREYEHVIRDVPDWMEPYPLVVRLHLINRTPDRAELLLKQQLSYRPDKTALLNLALARHLQDRPVDETLQLVEQSLALDPLNPTAHTTRAFLLTAAGRVDEAHSAYQTALNIDPENTEAQAGLRALSGTQ